MITTPVSEKLVYSAWDFETEAEATQAGLDALNLFLTAARELEARPEAAEMLWRRLSGPPPEDGEPDRNRA
jgi:hypothetical protein